jgi:hypothetical protein
MKTKYIISLIVLAYFVGFFTVRKTDSEVIKEITKIEYVKGEVIHDTISFPEPYWAGYLDTVSHKEIIEVPVFVYTDTAALYAVWKDYYLTRKYVFDFSTDTTGVFKLDISVNQNKAVSATSTIQPIIRSETTERTIVSQNRWQFWGLIGTNTKFDLIHAQIGLDYKKYKIGVSGFTFDGKPNYAIDVGMNF